MIKFFARLTLKPSLRRYRPDNEFSRYAISLLSRGLYGLNVSHAIQGQSNAVCVLLLYHALMTAMNFVMSYLQSLLVPTGSVFLRDF